MVRDHCIRAFESGLSLLYTDIHDVSKFNWMPLACTVNMCITSYCSLNVYVSFPCMMQGDNENIKVNLVLATCLQLNRFYCHIWSCKQHGII